jgi:hypothetical protein
MTTIDFDQIPTHFYVFLIFWTIAWITTKITSKPSPKNDHFSDNGPLLSFNNIAGITLASLSLYCNNEETFSESIVISWFTSFFIIDLLDCLYRKDIVFTVHALITLSLCFINTIPKYHELRIASLGTFTEASSPFLWRWKKTKKKSDFQIFGVIFFLCRLVWVPVYMIRCSRLVDFDDWVLLATVLFYLLQLLFFFQIVRILLNYREGEDDKGKKE